MESRNGNTHDEAQRLDTQRLATNAKWLAKLRWVALVGQLATILTVQFWLEVELDLWPLASGLAVTGLSNAIYVAWLARHRHDAPGVSPRTWYAVLGGLTLLDLVVLSAMLWATGGPTNPFVIFYFVNVALSAVLLPAAWAWTACGVAIGAIGLIYASHRSIEELTFAERLRPLSSSDGVPLAVAGEFIAFAACACVIVSFLTRLTSELRDSEQRRRRAEELRARSEKLEALGTLAAGAAHELATPLSTIAVVAGEIERDIREQASSETLMEDMQLIRGELERCRAILDRMALDSGQMIGEAPRTVSATELCEELIDGLSASQAARISLCIEPTSHTVTVPVVATAQALRGLVQNALDAEPNSQIEITASEVAEMLRFAIVDHGPGMSREVLDRLGEPFFTTKQPGRGMGLGWFLARSVVERLGGSIAVESIEGRGTRVTVELPASLSHNE